VINMTGRCSDQLRALWDKLPGGPEAIVDMTILGEATVVAVKGGIGDWAAYIGCGGKVGVAGSGAKLREKEARAFFDAPLFDCGEYRS
jgi:hypothetical protein